MVSSRSDGVRVRAPDPDFEGEGFGERPAPAPSFSFSLLAPPEPVPTPLSWDALLASAAVRHDACDELCFDRVRDESPLPVLLSCSR